MEGWVPVDSGSLGTPALICEEGQKNGVAHHPPSPQQVRDWLENGGS